MKVAVAMMAMLPASAAIAQQFPPDQSSDVARLPDNSPVQPSVYQGAPTPDMEARLRELEQVVAQQQALVDAQQAQTQALLQQLQAAQAPNAQAAAAAAAEPTPYVVGNNLAMQIQWNNGAELRTAGNDFYFHVGGRTQFDDVYLGSPNHTAALAGVSANSDGLQDGVDFRRARLRMEGSMYEQIDWCVEYNFVNAFLYASPTATAGSGNPQIPGGFQTNVPINNAASGGIAAAQKQLANTVQPVDLWWNIRNLPLFGNIQIGNQKEPFNVERLESSRYLDFLERNFGNDAFISPSANGFAPGIMTWNWTSNRRMTYAAFVGKNVTNGFAYNVGDGQGEVAGRATWLAWYDEPSGGRYFAHVGLGACSRAVDNGLINYRVRGDLRNGPDALIPSFINTGNMYATSQDIVNPEFMFQYGPLFIQSEFVANWTTDARATASDPSGIIGGTNGAVANGQHLGTLYFYNYYIQTMYFLTGEHRIYDYQKGLVGRVIPYENFFGVRRRGNRGSIFGTGAWQVGQRFQYIDLNNGGVVGGRMTGETFCVNWFLNPNMKVQANFDILWRDANGGTLSAGSGGTEGIIYGFGTRVAADF